MLSKSSKIERTVALLVAGFFLLFDVVAIWFFSNTTTIEPPVIISRREYTQSTIHDANEILLHNYPPKVPELVEKPRTNILGGSVESKVEAITALEK